MVSLGITWFCSPWRLQNAPWAGASVGDLAVALLRKTGTGRAALTWLRVSLLPQERLGLNGSFMGQWEASLLAGIPHTPPCPVWGPCCLAPFIVYPQLASSGMWLLTVPPQVPATLDKASSLNSCSFFMPSLRRCCCFPSEVPPSFCKIFPRNWRAGIVVHRRIQLPVGDTGAIQLWLPASWSHTPIDQALSSLGILYAASDFICRTASYHMLRALPSLLGGVLRC